MLVEDITLTLFLHPQIGWFTCDGADVNGTTLHEFEKLLNEKDEGWTAKEHDIL